MHQALHVLEAPVNVPGINQRMSIYMHFIDHHDTNTLFRQSFTLVITGKPKGIQGSAINMHFQYAGSH